MAVAAVRPAGSQISRTLNSSRSTHVGYICEVTVNEVESGKPVVRHVSVRTDGDLRFRMEEPQQGGFTMVYIVNGKNAWIFDDASRTGYWDHPADDAQAERRRKDIVGGPSAWRLSGAVRIGSQRINGIVCDVYRRRSTGGSETVWIPRGSRFPVSFRAVGTAAVGSLHVQVNSTYTFGTWRRVASLPDALFRPPSSYVIRDATKIRQGMRRK